MEPLALEMLKLMGAAAVPAMLLWFMHHEERDERRELVKSIREQLALAVKEAAVERAQALEQRTAQLEHRMRLEDVVSRMAANQIEIRKEVSDIRSEVMAIQKSASEALITIPSVRDALAGIWASIERTHPLH